MCHLARKRGLWAWRCSNFGYETRFTNRSAICPRRPWQNTATRRDICSTENWNRSVDTIWRIVFESNECHWFTRSPTCFKNSYCSISNGSLMIHDIILRNLWRNLRRRTAQLVSDVRALYYWTNSRYWRLGTPGPEHLLLSSADGLLDEEFDSRNTQMLSTTWTWWMMIPWTEKKDCQEGYSTAPGAKAIGAKINPQLLLKWRKIRRTVRKQLIRHRARQSRRWPMTNIMRLASDGHTICGRTFQIHLQLHTFERTSCHLVARNAILTSQPLHNLHIILGTRLSDHSTRSIPTTIRILWD